MDSNDNRTVCPRCGEGQFDSATAKAEVHSNVRAWTDHYATVWQCAVCGSLVSLQKVDLDPFYEKYPISNKKLDGYARQTYKSYVKALTKHGFTPRDSVLDYGCSTGFFIQYLRESGVDDVAGYDPYVEEFSDPKVLERKYDLVVAQDVIEHVEDPGKLFTELAGYLAKGGLLCIGTPRADGIDLSRPEEFLHELHVPYHICIQSERALLDLGAANSLESVMVHRRLYLDTPMPFVNWTFLRSYLQALDNTLDASFEDPPIGRILTSPKVLFHGFFGYWFPVHSNMLVLFRLPVD